MAAEDEQVLFQGKVVNGRLPERLPVRGHVNNLVIFPLGGQLPKAPVYGLGHQDHTRAAPEGIIVYLLVFVGGVVPQIMQVDRNKAFVYGPLQDRGLKRAPQQFR